MKICVISGSPKGAYSITLQTVLYLQKRFPADEFTIIHAGQRIRALAQDFSTARMALEGAELLLFCYPVYTFLAPSQLQRFIELMKESGAELRGKYAAQLSTSKHFYDITAHRYIEENCADLGLRYLGGLSADMEDLLKPQGQAQAVDFWRYIRWQTQQDSAPLPAPAAPPALAAYIPACGSGPERRTGRLVAVVADLAAEDSELAAMIEDFRQGCPYPTRLINLRELALDGGCLGCFHCAADGRCIYKDGFDEFLRRQIQTADATVYAFTLRDHSMGARFKMYDDRQFCNGHRTVTMGQPVGYLLRGDLAAESNLRLVLEGRSQVGGNFLAGIAQDGPGVARLAATLAYALEARPSLPANFLGVGGMKIFRDLIWQMRGLMKADHRFYRQHGFYDFPQKQPGTVLKMQLVGLLMNNPRLRDKLGNKMNQGMIGPYQQVLAAVDEE